jgi:exopolysaccharide biosynthesis polyprenyl glycosylphosphotransferase
MATVDSSPLSRPSRMPLQIVPPARWHDEVSRASATRTPTSTAGPPKHSPGILRPGGIFSHVRAWMVVVPLDGLLLLSPMLWNPNQHRAIASMTVLATLLLTGGGRYRARLHLSVLDELPSLVTRLLASAAIVATVIAFRHEQAAVVTFLANAAIAIGLVIIGRMLSTWVIAWARNRQISVHRTVIVGGGALAAELTKILAEHRRYGLSVVGFVDDGSGCIAEAVTDHLGRLDDLHRVVATSGADVILVVDGNFSERDLHEAVRAPACQPCDLLVVPRMHHFATQTGLGDHIGSIPVMRIRRPNLRGLAHTIKRLFDIVVAGSLLIICAPIIAVAALAVRLEGGPGVIFRQTRIGRDGVQFQCLKLRSMRPVSEMESDTNWSVADDKRVQPVGRFLRRTSLDELPQLWNILRGDMTLVGPRPERPHFVDQFSSQYDRYAHRHRMQAGLTGLAQVSGLRGDTSIADRTRYDNYYIEHWSLWLDVKIVFRTFSELLFARGR